MQRVHLTPTGDWVACDQTCTASPFHLDGHTPVSAAAISFDMLLPIFNIIQPPDDYNEFRQADMWLDAAGEVHRDYDLPAGIHADGMLEWYQHGQQHRADDSPAVIWQDGTREWLIEGQHRRLNPDDPAIIYADGTREWYENGQLHRGYELPAVIHANGEMEWWVEGECVGSTRQDDENDDLMADYYAGLRADMGAGSLDTGGWF